MRYLIYLAPTPEPGLPWGGYHITLVGRNKLETSVRRLYTQLYRALYISFRSSDRTKWIFKGKLKTDVRVGRKGCRLEVRPTEWLYHLASHLAHFGLQNVKGPRHAGVPWHITTYGPREDAQRLQEYFAAQDLEWHLYLVLCEDGYDGSPRWAHQCHWIRFNHSIFDDQIM